jgi:hypothetical protein
MRKLKYYQYLLIAADILLIPGLIFCEWLSDRMLATTSTCMWTLLGGKCITCGGTHFVNSLLNFRIAEAFRHNEFLFVLTALLLVVFVLLNLSWLFRVKFATAALKKIFTIPSLIIVMAFLLLFLLIRNIPTFYAIITLIGRNL